MKTMQIVKFIDRNAAIEYAATADRRLWVMLGDDNRFWVTSPKNCAKLENMGYEFAM